MNRPHHTNQHEKGNASSIKVQDVMRQGKGKKGSSVKAQKGRGKKEAAPEKQKVSGAGISPIGSATKRD